MRLTAGWTLLVCCTVLPAQDTSDPLVKALELADFYNWADAEPWFEAAKGSAGADTRRALYAELGLVRSTMERRVLPDTSEWLARQLRENPLLNGDDELRRFALTIKADIDFEIDVRPARRDWEQVRDIAQRRNDAKWIRRSQTELGFITFVEGDVGSAAVAVMGGIAAAAEAKDIGAMIRYQSAMGGGLILTRNHQLGLDRINQALAIEAANQPKAGYSFPAREYKVMALLGLKRRDEAFALAGELLSAARSRQKRVKECQLLITLAKYHRDEGNRDQAVALFTQARDLAEAGGFTRFLGEASSALAVISAAEGNTDRALELAARAAEATRRSGDFYLLPDRLHGVAKLHAALGKVDAARQAFEAAEKAGDFVLAWASNLPTRAALVNTLSQLYRDHFVLFASRGDVAQAFAVLESSRARTMRTVLAGEQITSERASSLRAQLAASSEPDAIAGVYTATLAEQLTSLTASQQRMVNAVDLKRVQASLAPKSVLLEYALAEPQSYCIVITRNTARIVALAGEKVLAGLISSYSDHLKQKREDAVLGQKLFRELLAPVTEIASHPELVISRDGALHLVPFEAFVRPDGTYVVMTHEVAYIPSATTVRLLRELPTKRGPAMAFLGVGGLAYDKSLRPKTAATRGYDGQALGNLPGSMTEVRNAATIAGNRAKLLLGTEGTEGAFKQIAADYRIIHMAVHGRVNSHYPENAALLLLPDEKSKDDGLLVSSEIVGLGVRADLVVLSACDSGVGMLLGQDGVANLSRAFLGGGARTVISTLWAADDISATSLLKRFYGQLGAKANVSRSLTDAKRQLIRTFHPVPYFWAAYIVEGVPGVTLQ